MSTGTCLPWQEAADIARRLHDELAVVCDRVKTAGSIRRRRPEVGDIEIVVQPRMVTAGLFGERAPDLEPIRELARSWGTLVKNGDRFIQVADVLGVTGVNLDLFLVHPPANYWCVLAIRTGPAELGKLAVSRLPSRGLYHQDGRILRADGSEYRVESEADFFAAAGLRHLPPQQRDDAALWVRPQATEADGDDKR